MSQKRQLVAIMFTDIIGYTALMQKDEKNAIIIRNKHRKVFNALTKKYHGELIQYYGDGTLSIFNSSVEAVKCGVEMQKAFQKEPKISVRIGIHSGDILRTDSDIIGDAVNVASRIESIGVANSVLISDKVNDQLKNQKDITTKYLDVFEFKNVEVPVSVYSVLDGGLVSPERKSIKGKIVEKENKSFNFLNPSSYFHEFKKLNVFKAAISYILFSWVLIQAAAILFPIFDFDKKAMSFLVFTLCALFPFWILFAYFFEWTSEGFKKKNSIVQNNNTRKITIKTVVVSIVMALSFALILFVFNTIFKNNESSESLITNKSIAVLAFADMSANKDQEYFSDGISEEILNLLTKIPNLKVVNRTSSFSFKNKEATISEIGKALNVDHLLQGSIRFSNQRFRITVQLIKVADESNIWSETYDRPIDDIFKIQDEIAATVTQQLKISLIGDDLTSRTANPEAYTLYLHAKKLDEQISAESNENAKNLLLQSIAIDSLYAPSWELLGTVTYKNYFMYGTEDRSVADGIDLVVPKAEKSISLDPNYAAGYALLAVCNRAQWNFNESRSNIQKALQLAPENSKVLKAAASYYIQFGNLDKSIALLEKAISLDPLNSSFLYNLGLYYSWNNNYEKAESNMKKYLLLNPNSGMGHGSLAMIYLETDRIEDAILEAEKDNHPFWSIYRECFIKYANGQRDESYALLQKIIDQFGEFASPNIASLYAYMGNKDKAFEWLEIAYKNKDSVLLEILNYPEMKNLWKDPRWNEFIKKLGLPNDHEFHVD